MSEQPDTPKRSPEDWLNRIIVLVIAAMAMIFGVPLMIGSAISLVTLVMAGEWPTPWAIPALVIGLAVTAFGFVIAWRAFVPNPKAKP
ncbi:MAG: hypothetical protein CMF75_02000 [Maricaulis sp.]|nr:hypothetical protein [Maricaulis sp.]